MLSLSLNTLCTTTRRDRYLPLRHPFLFQFDFARTDCIGVGTLSGLASFSRFSLGSSNQKECIGLFLKASSCKDCAPTTRQLIYTKTGEYLQRAEFLKQQMQPRVAPPLP